MPRMPSDGPLGTSPGPAQGSAEREPSPYVELDRDTWASLASEETTHLSAEEVERLRGFGEALDLDEVRQVYLPLSRLLSLRVRAAQRLHRKQEEFLQRPQPPRTMLSPFSEIASR